uniref:Phytocyanin domain-containing protein n=1 Tax=Leersia perrieri TaxID=77586 RepID=A0A0D9VE16_9ORYZ
MAAASSPIRLALVLLAAVLAAVAAAYPPASAPAPAPVAWMEEEATLYRVGGNDGWILPPPEDKELYYVRWASSLHFHVGDSLEFDYKNDSVIRVTKAGYYHCNETAGIDAAGDSVKVFRLDNPGFDYFASADLDRCNKGERLMINVHLADAGPPSPALAATPAPAPATGYDTGAGSVFPAASFGLVIAVAAIVMAGLV